MRCGGWGRRQRCGSDAGDGRRHARIRAARGAGPADRREVCDLLSGRPAWAVTPIGGKMSSIRTIALRRAAIAVVLALMLVACDWKGPAPTDASLTAASGPFAVSTLVVPSSAGFGGGTIYYPN